MSPPEIISVWVVAERRQSGNPWQSEQWTVAAVQSGRPQTEPWTELTRGRGWTRYFLGCTEIQLFRTETENYLFNIEGAFPAIYVILRRGGANGVELLGATVDPGEIDAHSDAGDDLIEALPLPPDIAARMRAFIAAHHKEQPFLKRRRDRADLERLGRRPPLADRTP